MRQITCSPLLPLRSRPEDKRNSSRFSLFLFFFLFRFRTHSAAPFKWSDELLFSSFHLECAECMQILHCERSRLVPPIFCATRSRADAEEEEEEEEEPLDRSFIFAFVSICRRRRRVEPPSRFARPLAQSRGPNKQAAACLVCCSN